jgi:hypothetical protein
MWSVKATICMGLGLASDVPEVERQCRRVNDAAECVPIVI